MAKPKTLEEWIRDPENNLYLDVVRKLNKNQDMKTYLIIQCLNCGDVFEQLAYEHQSRGQGCFKCSLENRAQTRRRSFEDWVKMFDQIYPKGKWVYHDLKREPIKTGSTHTQVLIECGQCSYTFWRRTNDHLRDRGCPECASNGPSKGHLLVREALEILGFVKDDTFFEEFHFDTCRYIETLPFDFYIPEYSCLIEYQGIQHYRYVEFFHKDHEGFAIKIEKDRIKKKWAEDNDYLLLRIPYKVDRLDLIVDGLIKRLDL